MKKRVKMSSSTTTTITIAVSMTAILLGATAVVVHLKRKNDARRRQEEDTLLQPIPIHLQHSDILEDIRVHPGIYEGDYFYNPGRMEEPETSDTDADGSDENSGRACLPECSSVPVTNFLTDKTIYDGDDEKLGVVEDDRNAGAQTGKLLLRYNPEITRPPVVNNEPGLNLDSRYMIHYQAETTTPI